MQQNCGLKALEGITKLENVSMFTLIHLAKDNGIDFYFCRVAQEDLPLVARPAIFHSDDHFTLVEDGKALPKENFSGWVLTPKPMGQPLPYSLAKQITGGKKASGFVGSILPFVGAAIGSVLTGGAAAPVLFGLSGASLGGAIGGLAGGAIQNKAAGGKEWWRIPLGGVTGAASGMAPGSKFLGMTGPAIAGLSSGAAALPNAIKTGNYGGAALAGLGGYIGAQGVQNFGAGVANAPAGAGLGGKVSSGVSNLFGGGTAPAAGATGTPQGGAAGGTYGLSPGGSFGPALSPYQPPTASTIAGLGAPVDPYTAYAQQGSNLLKNSSVVSSAGGGAGALAGGGATQAVGNVASKAADKGLFGLGIDKGTLVKGGIALAASQIGKPEPLKYDTMSDYNAASKYLQGASLPTPTMNQLNSYVTSSIADLKKEFFNPDVGNSALLNLDKQYQDALKNVERQAAQGGQSVATSSDAQRQYQEINRQWAEARSNLTAQLDQQATNQAVSVKQWAVDQSLAQGQFDVKSAMDLAAMIGRDKELQAAIDRDDYNTFQDIVRDILSINQGSQGTQGVPQNKNSGNIFNLSSVLGG